MDRIARLDAIVKQFDLNTHRFYTDWRNGTLPTEKLSDYAAEYGRFVSTIASGWETVGRHDYAKEEREHEVMWSAFQSGLPAGNFVAKAQTNVLVDSAQKLFAVLPEALGALYSFEAQQPITSQTKLDGLNKHYSLTESQKEYFAVHAGDVREVEDIREMMLELSDSEFERAAGACTVLCASMWAALDGIYYAA